MRARDTDVGSTCGRARGAVEVLVEPRREDPMADRHEVASGDVDNEEKRRRDNT